MDFANRMCTNELMTWTIFVITTWVQFILEHLVLIPCKYFHLFFCTFIPICDIRHSSFLTTISHWRPQTFLTCRTQSRSAQSFAIKKQLYLTFLYSGYLFLLPNDGEWSRRWYTLHIFYPHNVLHPNKTFSAFYKKSSLVITVSKILPLNRKAFSGFYFKHLSTNYSLTHQAFTFPWCGLRYTVLSRKIILQFLKQVTFVSRIRYTEYTNIYKQTIHKPGMLYGCVTETWPSTMTSRQLTTRNMILSNIFW
jgi:hypothetical protein